MPRPVFAQAQQRARARRNAMMTSTIAMQAQQGQGRTVRDVVEHNHELVNEAWCRKILRQVLQSLELQYAKQMPHRAITPETVVIQENGEPMLLPSPLPAAEQGQAADLQALAGVIHYAITRESPPAAPLVPRRLHGYSDSLVGAIDKCLASDPRQRPQTIDDLRNLLGIVSLGPPLAAAAPRARTPAQPLAVEVTAPRRAPLGRLKRWVLIGLAACVLLGAMIALLVLLHGTDSGDVVALSLPPADRAAQGLAPNETVVAPTPPHPVPGDNPMPLQSAPVVAAAPAPARQYAASPQAPAAMQSAAAVSAAAPTATQGTAYKLLIKPWGTVYVDGQDRGASPPLKRLVLPPGPHTVRIVNPNFRDRVIRIEAGRSASGRIVHNFSTPSR
jgi:hypothetical protein